MRIWWLFTSGIAVIALSTVTPTSAFGREVSPAWHDWLAVEGHLGLGTPMGFAGLAADLTPHPLVSINVGLGKGVGGAQYAAMARVRPLFLGEVFALGLGGGVSHGDTTNFVFPGDSPEIRYTQATWVNGEGFAEMRRGSFHLRMFVGVGRRVAYSDCTYDDANTAMPSGVVRRCSEIAPSTLAKYDARRTIPYTGVAVGFGLL